MNRGFQTKQDFGMKGINQDFENLIRQSPQSRPLPLNQPRPARQRKSVRGLEVNSKMLRPPDSRWRRGNPGNAPRINSKKRCSRLTGWKPRYAPTLGTPPADLADVAAGTQAFNWTLGKISEIRTSTQQWTAFKNLLRDGPESLPANPPTLPTLGAVPPNLDPGVFVRITEIVNRIKTSPAYTEAIGEDLGIVGPEHTVDLVNIKPTLTLRLKAGQPEIVWKKQSMTALEIHVGRGLGWQFLAVDTVPNYLDTAPQPPRRRALEIQSHLPPRRHPHRPME